LQRLLATRLQMNQDVETAYLAVRQNETAVTVAGTAREEAELNLAAAEARYQEGLAIIIEVTDAQLALVQAQLAELRARYDYALALAALSRAVGMMPTVATGEEQ
ncbi:MAG: TolC family protein, partial [Armatimonadetes bacterium]|nr:TolC family protein [Armatimonadota bacterium]